jgi:hypothetical protein
MQKCLALIALFALTLVLHPRPGRKAAARARGQAVRARDQAIAVVTTITKILLLIRPRVTNNNPVLSASSKIEWPRYRLGPRYKITLTDRWA